LIQVIAHAASIVLEYIVFLLPLLAPDGFIGRFAHLLRKCNKASSSLFLEFGQELGSWLRCCGGVTIGRSTAAKGLHKAWRRRFFSSGMPRMFIWTGRCRGGCPTCR
jgi:hypothetical protein